MTDFSKILDKAKELEAQMKKSQEKIKNIEVEGISGANSVKVILNGEGEMVKLEISPETIKEEKAIIEDLIVAAYNNAKVQLKFQKQLLALAFQVLSGQFNLMQNINELKELIKLISKLPGLGKRSAQRLILKLINNRDELMKPMVNNLAQVYKNVSRCKDCGTLKSNSIGCNNCQIVEKKFKKICVVEQISDQLAVENSNVATDCYFHVLGGTLSSSNKERKEDLLISSLVKRVTKDQIEEVIIATSATVEGQTTAYYIQEELKNLNVKVSKLGQGISIGSSVEDLEDGTLLSAFKNRTEIKNNSD